MTNTSELRRLRAAATGKYWERYGYIGSGQLAKVHCPSGCDRVGRQLYTEIPASGADATLICYLANDAIEIADEIDALRDDVQRLTKEREYFKSQSIQLAAFACRLQHSDDDVPEEVIAEARALVKKWKLTSPTTEEIA